VGASPDYPFRSGPSFLAGLVVFVVVNVFVYVVTGKIGRALAIGFALWLVRRADHTAGRSWKG
jgi:hypothetical protein